jgi:hypothetical protein
MTRDTDGAANQPTLYQALHAAGVPISNHCSDLYFQLTPTSQRILSQYPEYKGSIGPRYFTSQDPADNGAQWCDVPFAFDPFWKAVADKAAARCKGQEH